MRQMSEKYSWNLFSKTDLDLVVNSEHDHSFIVDRISHENEDKIIGHAVQSTSSHHSIAEQ